MTAALPDIWLLGRRIGGRVFARAVATLLIILLALLMIAPRAAPFYLGALGVIAVSIAVLDGRTLRAALRCGPLATSVALLALLGALSSIWAIDRQQALLLPALLGLALVLGLVVGDWIRQETGERLARLGLAVLVGFLIGLAYLVIETTSGLQLKRILFNTFEATRPDGVKHMDVLLDGEIMRISANTLNRNMTALSFLLWPALLTASLWPVQATRRVLVGLFAGGAAIAIGLSSHESSKLGAIAALMVFCLHWIAPLLTWQLIRAGWVVGVLGAVPLALAAHGAGLHEAGWLQATGKARIVLWEVAARETLKSPVLGIGAGSTKAVDEARKAAAGASPAGSPIEGRTGRHAHNIYLQIWYELGAIGAAILLAAGLLAISRLSRLPAMAQPYAAGFLAASMIIAGLSWGFWQPWYAPAFLLAVIVLQIAVSIAERDGFSFFAREAAARQEGQA